MTTFMLVRHGHCDPVGKFIAGRKEGVNLSEYGNKQVKQLVTYLKGTAINAIFSSPLERTVQTASPLAKEKGLTLNIVEELLEVDYGLWTGRTFDELSSDPLWHQYNKYKGVVRIPGGEMMLEVASRMSVLIERLRKRYEGNVVLVSHGDPIKTAIAHYAGIPLDFLLRFDVQPASISVIQIDDYDAKLLTVNNIIWQTDLTP
ncbi:MAG TPA: histidine phosphatase family protein [Chitinispirillaceae bacterium]|nr:histidine phosphatase family protein [Chitinispirillaceae bacterium]